VQTPWDVNRLKDGRDARGGKEQVTQTRTDPLTELCHPKGVSPIPKRIDKKLKKKSWGMFAIYLGSTARVSVR